MKFGGRIESKEEAYLEEKKNDCLTPFYIPLKHRYIFINCEYLWVLVSTICKCMFTPK